MDHTAAVAALGEALDRLGDVDAGSLTDDQLSEAVLELHRVRNRLAAVEARLTGPWDARQVWAADGARTGAAWLASRCRIPKASARRQVRRARALRDMPRVEESLNAGTISTDHVDAFTRVRHDHLTETFARDEHQLVTHAKRLPFHHFHRALTYWEQLADPDGVEDRAASQWRDRHAHLSKTFAGTRVLDATFDAVGGAEFAAALETIEHELFTTDYQAAKAEHGADVTLDKLTRTPAQRRADALVEMARRAMTAPRDGRQPRPLLTVISDINTVLDRICELSDGTVLTPGQSRRYAPASVSAASRSPRSDAHTMAPRPTARVGTDSVSI